MTTENESQSLGQDDIESLLRQAQSGIAEAAGDTVEKTKSDKPTRTSGATPFELGELQAETLDDSEGQSLDLLSDVELDLRIELGRTMMRLEEVLQLRGGAVVVLDKLAGDPVDIYVNGRLVAKGEVLVMNDNFCVRVTELVGAAA
jgi:flagellar motor switch protein FliN/FliY